ncbi:hypothetical protein BC938DRAFT_470635 [Jimgerdemannia flammicorona]|uniref:Uncharacterized protein n=1 Tax=Jimgerdemannia flammicorona TaxID=994334 RepID=A0A433Q9S2_9FUNG|nr:hypothetical protein BC938DRAFT_470635 [Jimgerdemannia flammicorona]
MILLHRTLRATTTYFPTPTSSIGDSVINTSTNSPTLTPSASQANIAPIIGGVIGGLAACAFIGARRA